PAPGPRRIAPGADGRRAANAGVRHLRGGHVRRDADRSAVSKGSRLGACPRRARATARQAMAGARGGLFHRNDRQGAAERPRRTTANHPGTRSSRGARANLAAVAERLERTFNWARVGGAALIFFLGPFFPNIGTAYLIALGVFVLG